MYLPYTDEKDLEDAFRAFMRKRETGIHWFMKYEYSLSVREDPEAVVRTFKPEKTSTNVCRSVVVHPMFLHAPPRVIRALGAFVSHPLYGSYREHQILASFIRENVSEIREEKLRTIIRRGSYHDLKKLFDEVNREYFDGKIVARPVWQPVRGSIKKFRKRIRMGAYDSYRKVIRIHRVADRPFIPDFVFRYLLYHEMLHEIYPPVIRQGRRRSVHHAAFKEAERAFPDYERCWQWWKENEDWKRLYVPWLGYDSTPEALQRYDIFNILHDM